VSEVSALPITVTKQPELELRESVDAAGKKQHAYYLRGEDGKQKRIPGVTTVCGVLDKPALKPWAAKMAAAYLLGERDPMNPDAWLNPPTWEAGKVYQADEIAYHCDRARQWHSDTARKAADLGTAAHDWMEGYIYGVEQPMPEHEKVKASVEKFLNWRAAHQVEWIEAEWSVTDGKVGGKIDVLARVDGVVRVLDLKTGNGIWPEQVIQVGKYHSMAAALCPGLDARPIILHASKDNGDFHAYELPVDPGFCAEFFARLYEDYRALQELNKATKAMVGMS